MPHLRRLHSFLYILLLSLALPAAAQQPMVKTAGLGAFADRTGGDHWNTIDNDSIEKTDVPIGSYVWRITPRFGDIRPAQPDTLLHLFPNDAFTAGRYGTYTTLGNLGAPRLTRLWDERPREAFASGFLFAAPYDFFLESPEEVLFTNTLSPLTNITYHECGNKQNGEDRITARFFTNVNKRLGLGFKLDYLYGRGYYDSQATAHFGGSLYGSYRGERYTLHAVYGANHLKQSENGGIESDDYVQRPESFPTAYGEKDMPTRLTKTWNKLNVNSLYLTQNYNFGFHRTRDNHGRIVKQTALRAPLPRQKALPAPAPADTLPIPAAALPLPADSVSTLPRTTARLKADSLATDTLRYYTEYVPVGGFVHTLRLDHNNRRFLSNLRQSASDPHSYFRDYYLPGDSASDFTKHLRIENTLALEMREGFNPWVKTGMRLYARHAFERITLPTSRTQAQSLIENRYTLGAQLLKHRGRFFHYDLIGELRTSGKDWGEFNVEGTADFNLALRGDTLRFVLDGHIRAEEPSIYLRHFHARNAWWDSDLDNQMSLRLGGSVRYRQARLSFHIETLQNFTYLQEAQQPYIGEEGVRLARYAIAPGQTKKNIRVTTTALSHTLRLGIFSWENELALQLSSDEDYLPLPLFNAYSNLNLQFRVARVLRTELGVDARFYTKYYAPTYSPIFGAYCLQDRGERFKLGSYPDVNAYAAFALPAVRFYIMASHLNYSSGNGFPFTAPHYPMNRMVVRLGLSWNFFN